MRNWNTTPLALSSPSRTSFEPTYEELKLFWSDFFFVTWGVFWAYLWGIETHQTPRSDTYLGKVLSLPMRNWNMGCEQIKRLVFEVLSLPMRNWNAKWGWDVEVVTEFWAYLWGIETPSRLTSSCVNAFCFEPTYEELKQPLANPTAKSKESFEPTYEELKLTL